MEQKNYVSYKDKYNKKYGYAKSKSHTLAEVSKDTGVSLKGLQQIYNKGIGAYKTNPQSVRPNVKSKEQWAMARVYSAVMGGKASKIDSAELKMEKGGLVAPNGLKSNLTPLQYKLVRTPQFKAWFGDWENDPANASKVVDENGEPLVVYHASNKKFTKFKDSKYSSYIFFSNDKDHVEIYGDIVYKCFLSIKTPSVNLYPKADLKENNQDGFINRYNTNNFFSIRTRVYAVLYSNQIKLADGTNKTFDGNNPDIRFDEGGELSNGYKLPKYLYHLTSDKIFENIKKEKGLNPEYSKQSKGEKGIYLTDDKSVAENYAGFFDAGEKLVLLKISTDDMDMSKFTSDDYELQDFLDDGGWGNDDERIEEYSSWDEVPFELSLEWVNQVQYHKFIPIENIKIDGTNTTFDGSNPDIRFEGGGRTKEKTIKVNAEYQENQFYEINKQMDVPVSLYKQYQKTGEVPREFRDDFTSEVEDKDWIETNPLSLHLTPIKKMESGGRAYFGEPIEFYQRTHADGTIERFSVEDYEKNIYPLIEKKMEKMETGGNVGQEITCHNCGWHWNTNQSAEFDKYVCHNCGFDNSAFY